MAEGSVYKEELELEDGSVDKVLIKRLGVVVCACHLTAGDAEADRSLASNHWPVS